MKDGHEGHEEDTNATKYDVGDEHEAHEEGADGAKHDADGGRTGKPSP